MTRICPRANITTSDQYSTDPVGGRFSLRMEFHLDTPEGRIGALRERFQRDIGDGFGMTWRITSAAERQRVAVLVSRDDHCLIDLLWQWRRGELDADIPIVVSNHPDLRPQVETLGVRYEHVPVAKGAQPAAEARILGL